MNAEHARPMSEAVDCCFKRSCLDLLLMEEILRQLIGSLSHC